MSPPDGQKSNRNGSTSANGHANGKAISNGRRKPQNGRPALAPPWSDDESARLVIVALRTRQIPSDEDAKRLSPEWNEAALMASADGDDGLTTWEKMTRLRLRNDPSRFKAMIEALDRARTAGADNPSAGCDAMAGVDPDRFGNVYRDDDKTTPRRIDAIDDVRKRILGDWPKRVGSTLFVEGEDGQPLFLTSTAQLFARVDRVAEVDWGKGSRYITQERYFEHLRMTAPKFEAVEVLPHWPEVPSVFYMHPTPKGGRGHHLDGFLSFFTPASTVDAQLLRAMALTLFWGGPPGQRPAFLIEGPTNDPQQGRGIGKTRLVDVLSEEIGGGYLDVEPTDTMAAIKSRLLSEDGLGRRVCRLDNIKTLRFSWGDLEKLVTSPVISGHALYRGEGRRPNFLTWVLTVNGANLSKDMALRVIPIRLARPAYSGTWERDIRAYCREHRWEIIGDIGAALSKGCEPITPATRWGTWEAEVLARLPEAEACQKVIKERQAGLDDDDHERDIVRDTFRARIKAMNREPDEVVLFISSGIVAKWLEEATGEKRPTNRASNYLGGLGIQELRKSASKEGRRGWRWTGTEANSRATAEDVGEILG